ncbi:2'-5' RNA ligase family protein [Paraflavitalea sp. CAU 1676]|uniref:2'-5' RNA ligase family protein n=1 Tax=Paraflavitalea sp. CAU 1676 TaxID=3032598 RepID=UPI0023DC5609|nr:2'-5' RNA ligase family protein [Paraflavitalea sp. CAU 1676]MDF2187036.1 2'-5' RNA ligase family protein [Paraflavitalea sp. CAU 1676]
MTRNMQISPVKKIHGTPRAFYEDYTSQLRVNEYMLVLLPHEELRKRVLQIRKDFYEAYQAPSALGAKVHIPLATFTQLEIMEERIVNRLKVVGMGYYPFKVELKDYGTYPSHTLYINVTTKLPIQKLVREIRDSQRLMKLDNEHKPHFLDDPHLTIARKLLPWQYEKGWLEYSHRHFTGRFIADCMLLLKRRAGDKTYQIAQRFDFMNLPVSTKQGELFV